MRLLAAGSFSPSIASLSFSLALQVESFSTKGLTPALVSVSAKDGFDRATMMLDPDLDGSKVRS